MDKNILLIGGDKRQLYCAGRLEESEYNVQIFGIGEPETSLKELTESCKTVILPLPVSRDRRTVNMPLCGYTLELDTLIDCLDKRHSVFGGMIGCETLVALESKGVKCHDYFKSEELALKNAIATAEGVLLEAISSMEINLFGSQCLITGYGRTARQTAEKLRSLGAETTVAVRNSAQKALAFTEGHKSCLFEEMQNKNIWKFDLLVNTVPAQIIGNEILSRLKKDCLIIEIASPPCGIDFEATDELGLKVIKAMSLPGKVSPKTTGRFIADTIINIAREGK